MFVYAGVPLSVSHIAWATYHGAGLTWSWCAWYPHRAEKQMRAQNKAADDLFTAKLKAGKAKAGKKS